MTTSSADPKVNLVAHVILEFAWHNYGLDDVGLIGEEYAEYAWDLAAQIVGAQEDAAGA